MTMTTLLEERLRPLPYSTEISKRVLTRSTSFDVIRRFPTNLCRQGSTEIIQWLSSSKSKLARTLSQVSKQGHLLLLSLSVYSAFAFLAAQLIACLAVIFNGIPTGLAFLLICVAAATYIAIRILFSSIPQNTRHRNRTIRRLKQN